MENNPNQSIITPSSLSSLPSITPQLPKPKKKLWKKILLVLVLIIVLLGLVFYNLPRILTLLYPGDAVLADNSQLLLQKISVPDEENGFFDFFKINNCASDNLTNCNSIISIPKGFDDIVYTNYTKPIQWNQPLVDEVLQKNQQALALFDQAANKKYFQIPDYSDPANLGYNSKLYSLNSWRTVARLQAIKALSLSYQGKPEEALQEAVKLNKVGHEIVVGHNDLIGTLVGMAIQQLGSQTILQILPYGSPSKAVLAQVESAVKNSSDNIEGYKDAFRFTYTKVNNEIGTTANADVRAGLELMVKDNNIQPAYLWIAKYPYYNKPNETKNLYTALYAPQVAAVGNTCNFPAHAGPIIKDIDPVWNLIFRENAIGKLFYSLTGASLGSAIKKECQIDFATDVAQSELALRQYKIDNGSLPATLDALVPQYLDRVPLDPFDHQPMRYNDQKKILYSVGVAKKDLGGSEGDDWTKMNNPTFQIKF